MKGLTELDQAILENRERLVQMAVETTHKELMTIHLKELSGSGCIIYLL